MHSHLGSQVGRISCGIPVGPDEERGLKYAINALRSAIELASAPISYTLALDPKLDHPSFHSKIMSEFPGQRINFVSTRESSLVRRPNSCGYVHGELLQTLIESAETELFCVLDADTSFLMKDWDLLLARELDAAPRPGRERVIIVGSESPLDDKYREFPTSMFFAFRTAEFKSLGIQMNKNKTSITRWPGYGTETGGKGWVVVSDENKHLYCRDPGTKLYMDTGFEMMPAVRSSPYDWRVFRAVKSEGYEWYFTEDGTPVLTHMTGSYVRPWGSDISREWRIRVEQVKAGTYNPA